jgi:hypothetical protein
MVNIKSGWFFEIKLHFCSIVDYPTGCHSREGGNPSLRLWIPAFAGMTAISMD